MRIEKIPYHKVSALSKKDMAYIGLADYLTPYYDYKPDISEIANAITTRKQYPVDRKALVEVLQRQYQSEEVSQKTMDNILSLAETNTFTIITAHQPALFTGPLYYIFKISSCINLCRQLNKAYPNYNFVPLFINGSEDHDFEEIDHCHIDHKTIRWDRSSAGSVGNFSVDGLEDVIQEAEQMLSPSRHRDAIIKTMKTALKKADNYDDFVLTMVNALFGTYGLVIANGGDRQLKANFADIIRQEIFDQPSKKRIEETQAALSAIRHKPQAHARPINLFYKYQNQRIRIEQDGHQYRLVGTDVTWTRAEMEAEINQNPERFSPNVAMRPIYQEFTFPNLAYIGGGGEIAYWLERKTQFEYYKVFYPMLIRRNSAMIVKDNIQRTISKLDLSIDKYFAPTHSIINNFLDQHTETGYDLSSKKETIDQLWKAIAEHAKSVDPTLEMTMLAKGAEQKKAIAFAEKKIKKHLKAKEQINVNRIEKIRNQLFPKEGLQERYDNFLPYFSEDGQALIDFLIDHLDPMDRQFSIIYQS